MTMIDITRPTPAIRILLLEAAAPGPHHDELGMTPEAYEAWISRLLYDAEANSVAGPTLARLRAERCHPSA